MTDAYTTIVKEARAETRVQGSRFIAVALPASSRDEVEAHLERVRQEFHDATHRSFAFRLGPSAGDFRSSDDGEPGGTAGRPILAAIDRTGLTDILLVVPRYFGGTKLGTGGLARAYGDVCAQVLARAETVTRHVEDLLEIAFPHAFVGGVMHALSSMQATIADTSYDEEVHLKVHVRRSRAARLRTLLLEQTRGNIRIR